MTITHSFSAVPYRGGVRPFRDVHSLADYWSWLQTDLLDQLYWLHWYNGRATHFDQVTTTLLLSTNAQSELTPRFYLPTPSGMVMHTRNSPQYNKQKNQFFLFSYFFHFCPFYFFLFFCFFLFFPFFFEFSMFFPFSYF